jgi:hypothetical protein
MSYRFNVGIMENIAIEPYVLYRQSSDGLQDAWEAASLIYFKDKVWTGAGYNQNNGLALFVGMNLKDKFKFNYSYEFPPFKSGIAATSAHELHLTLKFGKKKELPFAKKTNRPSGVRPANEVSEAVVAQNNKSTKEDRTEEQEETRLSGVVKDGQIQEEKADEVDNKTNPELVKIDKNAIAKTEEPKPVGRPTKSFTIAKGHYVVVGVFSMMDHSTRFTKSLLKEGYDVNVALNPKNKFYYVYIFSSYDLEEARKARNQYRWKNLLKEAWVFSME